jgi:intraflagellar transport protein 172
MLRVVEERFKNDLVSKGDGEELIRKTGDVDSALDMYARQGDWTKCLTLAEKQSPNMLPHYLIQYCKIQAHKGEILAACQALVRYGPPNDEANNALYKVISNDLLSSSDATGPSLLREMLLRLLAQTLDSTPPAPRVIIQDRNPQAQEFFKALLTAHYQTVRARLREQKQGSSELVAKISISACRYCTEFPVDRAFYEAGMDCKSANMINMAFFFFNRFLDIADAIEDPEGAGIDNTDFNDTDIPSPYDLDLPETPHIEGPQVEEIRDWVLGWSMDQSVQQQMDVRPCDKCKVEIYTATLICPKCSCQHDPCAVSGYPVLKRTRVECSNCKCAANRDDWNPWLQMFKTCPWCQHPQNSQY